MYEQFFGLRELPFELTPDPRFLVLTDGHEEALSNLEYGVSSRKGITLLLGEAGSGKTTVIRAAIDRQPDRVRSVHLHNPMLTREEFVEILARHFELSERAASSKAALLLELEKRLTDERRRGESTVLVVDEAQRLSSDLLEELRLLSNIETEHEKLLPIIIAGQPELADRLEHPDLRQFKQRVALRCELPALTLRESVAYLAGRIRAAGGVGGQVFTKEAVCLLHERAGGLPRLLNVIADNCLLGGLAAGQKPVGTAIVGEVCHDLRLEPRHAVAPQDEHRNGNGRRDGSGRDASNEDAPAEPATGAAGPRKRFLFF